jgi:cytochrome c553
MSHIERLCSGLLVWVLLPSLAVAQPSSAAGTQKAWSRLPREIPFQNDAQWEDNRWQSSDVGPFVTASIALPRGITFKGLAIRVGDRRQAAVCFDTGLLRISAAWTGEFLTFGPRRFGLIQRPSVAGTVFYETPSVAGWARGERFQPRRAEYTLPDVEQGYTPAGQSIVHLPKDWAHYHGLYTCGQRVVLSYAVASAGVLESPWYVESGDHGALVRSLEIGPATETLRMWVADAQSQVRVRGAAAARLDKRPDGATVLVVSPHTDRQRIQLLIASAKTPADELDALQAAAGGVQDLSRLIASDPGRFPQVLRTAGTTTETGGPYVIDTLTLPFDNPYKALLFTSGHDFFSDGTAAVCTVHGDVWRVAGIDRRLKQLRWRRFATGLFQPLGLKIVDDKVYVIGRDQITRLHDRNNDGEADFYENFNNDLFVSAKAHDYVTCLDTDPQGNFYFIHGKTGVMRVSADGSTLTTVADGFRNPNGMAVGPDGTITAAPQQGTWTPESSIIVVRQGGYYGFGGPRIAADRPAGWELPMCFIPRSMDNSGGAQVWVEGDRWGPINGQMLHLSYGQCRLLLSVIEKVDGVYQGGTIKLPTVPADFESGIMRGRFNPRDGQLYVSGLRGWQTRAVRDGCFQRLRYTGGPLHLPTRVKTYTNGIKLTFTDPLEPDTAQNPENYFVEQWNYRWSQQYGSPDFSVEDPRRQGRDEVTVVSATLMDSGRAVFLEMPGRQPVMQLSIDWMLNSAENKRLRGTYAHTINAAPNDTMPGAGLVRRPKSPRISEDVEQRLRPGVQFRFRSHEAVESDVRVSRLVALNHAISTSVTPFLPPGPFGLDIHGTLRTTRSGFYDFRIAGTGQTRLWINDELIVSRANQPATQEPLLLRKGHNRLRVRYDSPAEAVARLKLSWKGYNFDWEPVPPSVLFHDSGADALVVSARRRLGRRLYVEHHCARCHQTAVGEQSMLELSLRPPDLSTAGHRFTNAWLQRWLVAPRRIQAHTRMPAVLGQSGDAARDAADISAFLIAQQDARVKPLGSSAKQRQTGRLDGAALFESLGCIACHHFEAVGHMDEWGRRSLRLAGTKYRTGALARFLKKPAAHNAASEMPDFRLSDPEAAALAEFVRSKSPPTGSGGVRVGNAARGGKLFERTGCNQCHSLGKSSIKGPTRVAWSATASNDGCLTSATRSVKSTAPDFGFSDDHIRVLQDFIRKDLHSLQRSSRSETSARLVQRLRCGSCHDRDGQRSHRPLVIAEVGSGRVPQPLPALTWAGEKLRPAWTESLLAGKLAYKSRPWLAARMPAFPAYAQALALGLAAEHGVDPQPIPRLKFDAGLAVIGEELTRQTALDCRQCHAIGDQRPRGDKNTKIHQGINFSHIRDRLRREAYDRLMLDPPRYDINNRMVKISANGLSTKLRGYFDADARQQFGAVWHYIQSLPAEPER